MYLEQFIRLFEDSEADEHYKVYLEVDYDGYGQTTNIIVDHEEPAIIIQQSY